MSKTINKQAAIETLRKVVAERGEDFIYRDELRQQGVEEAREQAEGIVFDDSWSYYGPTPEERKKEYVEQKMLHARRNVECSYAEPDGTPSCGVGAAVFLLDRKLYDQMAIAEEANGPFAAIEINDIVGRDILTNAAARVFEAFQVSQDRGDAYGTALSKAEEVAN